MAYQNLLFEQPDTGLYLLSVNRPRALNALNPETLEELHHAIGEIASDPAARVVIITGAGDRAFVAGADIAAMQSYSPLDGERFSALGMRVMHAIEALPIPAIALVNGYALGGGCELALACDWILASDKAIFGQPEVKLGIPPGFGGTQRLTRAVGRAMALELLTTGRQVTAEEALAIGLANHVYPAADLRERGFEMARLIAANAPIAVRLAKECAHRALDIDLASGCALETQSIALAFGTADQKEGMSAFLAKRPADFKGR